MRRIALALAALAAVGAPLAAGDAPPEAPLSAELPAGVPREWRDPPAGFRPLQIVHGIHPRGLRWEGIHEVLGGEDPEKKVASGIEAYRALGLGGIVCNVDFKDYMKSEDAFRTLEAGVEACARLGLEVWLYDEDGYPSGSAGGLVLAENPEFEARVLAHDPSLPEPFFFRRAYEHTHASNNFYAARRAIDVIDDRAVRSFIAHTHEVYARRVGRHFGTTIRAFFTDEPSFMAVDTGLLPESVRKRVPVRDPLDPSAKPLPTVPWTYDIAERYRERYGEDLLAVRASLFGGSSSEDRRARRQFWALVGDLFAARYFGQIEDWCARHRVASSGHGLWEESILHHVGLWGNALRALARMGIPGLDELSSNPETAVHGGWMTAALPASAAALAGRRRVMTEVSDFVEKTSGRGPAPLADMQATAAWQAAWGVTEFTLYYAIPDRSAEEYRAYCDTVGRLNAILAEARPDPEALLYYPIRDLWEEYVPVAGPLSLESQSERAGRIVRSFDRLGRTLVRSQVPFILADADALAGARAGASGLVVAGRAFRAAIVPDGCELPEAVAATLAEFRASGGAVLADEAASPLSKNRVSPGSDPNFRFPSFTMYRSSTFFCLLAAATSIAPRLAALDLHVSPGGDDRAGGRSPAEALASLQGARDAIRRARTEGARGPFRVLVAEGEYPVAETLVLEPEDGGTAEAPVSYEAAPGAKPVFSGGLRIRGLEVRGDGLWAAKVPGVAEGTVRFEQLWVGGRRAVRARSPNKFYHYVLEAVDRGADPETGEPVDLARRAFRGRREDLAGLAALDRRRLSEVTVVAYHSWETSRSRIAAFDPASGTVILTAPVPWPFNQWGPSQRYHLENYAQALDAPGEWYLDPEGMLLYRPLPGEDPWKVEVVAPAGPEEFVRIAGDPDRGRFVEHLTFRGLSFRHGQYLLPATGHADGQAEVTVPAAIVADGARHLTFERCEVSRVGVYALWFRRGCTDCRVRQCHFYDLGAGGVKIGEGWGANLDAEAVRTSRIAVEDAIIRSGGRIHHGAIGVWIGHSGSNAVEHCDISDFYYTGISVGWTWGYAPTISKGNRIVFNHIHHLGWGVLSDMGGVYTLGDSTGTEVSDNWIHDVWSYDRYGRGGWGLYNDEGTANIVMERNLVHDVKTGTYHQHYGKDNLIRNNILAFSRDGQIQRSRVEEHRSFIFTRNIVVWDEGPLYSAGSFRDANVTSEKNLYWDYSGAPVRFHESSLEEWQVKGKEPGSIVADPLFADAKARDFRLRPESPVFRLGFEPFDYTRAGVRGDPEWVALAKGLSYPPVELPPEK